MKTSGVIFTYYSSTDAYKLAAKMFDNDTSTFYESLEEVVGDYIHA